MTGGNLILLVKGNPQAFYVAPSQLAFENVSANAFYRPLKTCYDCGRSFPNDVQKAAHLTKGKCCSNNIHWLKDSRIRGVVRRIHAEYLNIVAKKFKIGHKLNWDFRRLHIIHHFQLTQAELIDVGGTADIYKSNNVYFKIIRDDADDDKMSCELESRTINEFCWTLILSYRKYPGFAGLHMIRNNVHSAPVVVFNGKHMVGFAIEFVKSLTEDEKQILSLEEKLWIFIQLVDSVMELHEYFHTFHGDLNLKNVILVKEGQESYNLRPVIIDYGQMDSEQNNDDKMVEIWSRSLLKDYYQLYIGKSINMTYDAFRSCMLGSLPSMDSMIIFPRMRFDGTSPPPIIPRELRYRKTADLLNLFV